jgi:hypothetical protein
LQQAVRANLQAIPHPTYGVGAWLGMVMEATEYRELNGFDWVEPQLRKKPTRTLFSFLTGAAAQAQQEYRQDLIIYTQYRKIVRELRTQLLNAVDKACLESIPMTPAERKLGLAAFPPKDILTYILTTYGTMSDTQLEKNRNRLRDVANPTQPIAHLFLRVREICDTAELAGPEHTIPDECKISLIQESMEKAGAYGHMLTTWNDKSKAKRSGPGVYDRFVKHCKEQKEHRLRNATARTERFAHIATTTVPTKRPAATDTRSGDNKHPKRQANNTSDAKGHGYQHRPDRRACYLLLDTGRTY